MIPINEFCTPPPYTYLYDAGGAKNIKRYYSNTVKHNSEFYVGSAIYQTDTSVGNPTISQLKYMMTDEGRLSQQSEGDFAHEYMIKDHLGNTRVLFADYNNNDSIEQDEILQQAHYYPFGLVFMGFDLDTDTNKFLYNGKELQTDGGLGWYDYGFRFYDPSLGRWHSPDPLAEKYLNLSPYIYVGNNPVNIVDPDGLDWYEIDGQITWRDHEGKLTVGDNTYQSLGKNVIVITHNRNEDGVTEELNSATFTLYLESNTDGATATIIGNTVPDDPKKSGTLAEGLYSAEAQSRASYKNEGKTDLAILINGGKELPTVKGNPSKKNSDMLTEVFIHMGNNYGASLHDSQGNAYSKGCQTGGNYKGSHAVYNTWRSKAPNFKGNVYLRGKPISSQPVPVSTATPVNNTSTRPSFIQQLRQTIYEGINSMNNPDNWH